MRALLLMSYCMLSSIDDLLPFYTHLHHGRTPDEAQLDEARLRYRSLGKPDPLGVVTVRQARALERRLERIFHERFPVYIAFRHTAPFIEETVRQMKADGVSHLFTLPLSPLASKSGTGSYQRDVLETRDALQAGFAITDIDRWHLHPGFTAAVSTRVKEAMQWISRPNRERTMVIFTTHSKPGKPEPHRDYIRAFSELAHAVASQAQCSSWKIGYRSGGPAPQRWLGPDVKELLREAAQEGWPAVVVCDLLTIAENIEVLYDCRIDIQQHAEQLGLEFVCADFLNDTDDAITALEQIVCSAVHSSEL
ncbi:ferrochelatase [Paenibacillaceae bacterium]|nr:ferrochelatase [Paenibacillaceae bacterium]